MVTGVPMVITSGGYSVVSTIERGTHLRGLWPCFPSGTSRAKPARMSTRTRLGLVFSGSIFLSVMMAACSTQVVSTSSELRSAGAACAFPKQCASGQCSVDEHSGECGICLDVRKLNESCGGPDQSCNKSAVCVKGTCQSTRRLLGDSCSVGGKGGDPCDDELYCDRPMGNQGTCAAPVAVGVACDRWSSKCVEGAYCDRSGVCVVPPADSCELHPCSAGSFCDVHKTCRPATLNAGERCGIVDGEPVDNACAPGTACGHAATPSSGAGPNSIDACLLLPTLGEICVRNHCAAGLFCAQQTTDSVGVIPPRCEALREEGDACTRDSTFHIDCGAGLECRHRICQRACD